MIDATNEVLGRLASQVAKILRGKNKPSFTPHVDCGDVYKRQGFMRAEENVVFPLKLADYLSYSKYLVYFCVHLFGKIFTKTITSNLNLISKTMKVSHI